MDKDCTKTFTYGFFDSLLYGAREVLGEFNTMQRSKSIMSISNADAFKCDIEMIAEDYKLYMINEDSNKPLWQKSLTDNQLSQKEALKR